jgi:hypothetical protein
MPSIGSDIIDILFSVDAHLCFLACTVLVPDRRRRIIPEVVLVRRWVAGFLGIWRGEGLGKGLGQGRSVYKQPETEVDGSCHSQEGSK